MHFKQIEIENFGTINKVVLKLEKRGLVLVTGKNKDTPKADSNGAGKSLLLDAFCWAIWGRTVRDDKDDDVVNNRVGKNCRVAVSFMDGKKAYQVIRYRKHEGSKKPNDLELFLNSVDLSSASMKMTQEVISGIIGLSFETFCALMPGAGKNAAQMTDSDIKELLENMLQITALAKARDAAEARLKALRPRMASAEQFLGTLEVQTRKDQQRLETLQSELEAHDTKKRQVLQDLARDLAQIQAAIVATESALREVQSLRVQRADLEALRQRTYDESGAVSSELHALEMAAKQDLRAISDRRIELNTELRLHTGVVSGVKSLAQQCQQCYQPIPAGYKDEVLAQRAVKIAQLNNSIAELDQEQVVLQENLAKTALPLENSLKQWDAAAKKLSISMRELDAKIAAGTELTYKLAESQRREVTLTKQIEEKTSEVSPYEAWILSTKKDLADAEEARVAKQAEFDADFLESRYLEFWKDAFSAKGIRSFILNNVTPVLNERAAHYCQLLTEGEMTVLFSTQSTLKNGEVREKFAIDISQKHGGSSYRSNSKGERQRANLAVCFALSDLAEMHSHKRIDFRFLDEPFEGIDESGTEAVLSVLNEQRTKYPTVFVVTHQGHFKEAFPAEITMVKEKGFSSLVDGVLDK